MTHGEWNLVKNGGDRMTSEAGVASNSRQGFVRLEPVSKDSLTAKALSWLSVA
jgi:hypothetical protein